MNGSFLHRGGVPPGLWFPSHGSTCGGRGRRLRGVGECGAFCIVRRVWWAFGPFVFCVRMGCYGARRKAGRCRSRQRSPVRQTSRLRAARPKGTAMQNISAQTAPVHSDDAMCQQPAVGPRPVVRIGADERALVEPDMVRMTIRFGKRQKTQQDCAEHYVRESALARRALEPLGLDGELTCSGFHSYAHVHHRRGTIEGYDYWATGSLSFRHAEHDVMEVWNTLMSCGMVARVGVDFYLDDRQAAEDALIGRAVERARSRAATLAAATGTRLAGVKEIRYNCVRGEYFGFRGDACSARRGRADDFDEDELPSFDPEPVEVECHVDVEWWLEG